MRRKVSIRARAPRAVNGHVRRVMRANRSVGTRAERVMREALDAAGVTYRINAIADNRVKCLVDFVLDKAPVCIFVDGCFWHGCPAHFRVPKLNRAWWSEKMEDNRRRDKRKSAALRRCGWSVVRVWEHDLDQRSIRRVVARVLRCLDRRVSESGVCFRHKPTSKAEPSLRNH